MKGDESAKSTTMKKPAGYAPVCKNILITISKMLYRLLPAVTLVSRSACTVTRVSQSTSDTVGVVRSIRVPKRSRFDWCHMGPLSKQLGALPSLQVVPESQLRRKWLSIIISATCVHRCRKQLSAYSTWHSKYLSAMMDSPLHSSYGYLRSIMLPVTTAKDSSSSFIKWGASQTWSGKYLFRLLFEVRAILLLFTHSTAWTSPLSWIHTSFQEI